MTAAVLRAAHTHLYPGARLQADGPLAEGAGFTLVFADLGSASARVQRVDGELAALSVGGYRTARGTNVAAKRWLLEPGPASAASGRTWRVVRRLDDLPR